MYYVFVYYDIPEDTREITVVFYVGHYIWVTVYYWYSFTIPVCLTL